jgi:hypothetical protein
LNYIEIKTTVQTPKPQTETQEQTSSKTSQTNPASKTSWKPDYNQNKQSTRQENTRKQTSSWNLRQKRLINIPALTETNVFLGLLKLSFP